MNTTSILGKLKKLMVSQSMVLFIFIIIITVVTATVNPNFMTWTNISSMLRQATSLSLVAAGMTILIISGDFDISVGSMIGLTTCSMAMMINAGVDPVVASIAGILICVACSVTNCLMAIIFNAPSFIVTLATGRVYYGMAIFLTQGYIQTLYGQYRFLASYTLFDVIPFLFVVMFLGFLSVYLILKYTRTGREVYAIGTNDRAAFLSGINVKLCKVKFYAISGILVGIASMVLLSRVSSAQSTSGSGMELTAIGAVVIGGTAISGGKGSVIGTFFGVILLSMISSVINMLPVSTYAEEIVSGLVIVVALGVTALREQVMLKQRD